MSVSATINILREQAALDRERVNTLDTALIEANEKHRDSSKKLASTLDRYGDAIVIGSNAATVEKLAQEYRDAVVRHSETNAVQQKAHFNREVAADEFYYSGKSSRSKLLDIKLFRETAVKLKEHGFDPIEILDDLETKYDFDA